MSVEQKQKFTIVSKESFIAIGFKWDGTFAEAAKGGIRKIQAELKERLDEIEDKVEADVLLGLSYHATEASNGFTHYACVEVTGSSPIPHGMVSVTVPSSRYAVVEHQAGGNIEESYNEIYTWIQESGLKPSNGLTHFEKYPMGQNPYTTAPAFTIMIPIKAE